MRPAGHSFGGVLLCVRVCRIVCVCVCDLGTTTNSQSGPHFAAAPHKITQTLLTDTRIAVGVFFQLLDSAVVSDVWTFR